MARRAGGAAPSGGGNLGPDIDPSPSCDPGPDLNCDPHPDPAPSSRPALCSAEFALSRLATHVGSNCSLLTLGLEKDRGTPLPPEFWMSGAHRLRVALDVAATSCGAQGRACPPPVSPRSASPHRQFARVPFRSSQTTTTSTLRGSACAAPPTSARWASATTTRTASPRSCARWPFEASCPASRGAFARSTTRCACYGLGVERSAGDAGEDGRLRRAGIDATVPMEERGARRGGSSRARRKESLWCGFGPRDARGDAGACLVRPPCGKPAASTRSAFCPLPPRPRSRFRYLARGSATS